MKYFFVLLLVLFPHLINAQLRGQEQIDSLQQALTYSKGDTNEVLLRITMDSLYNSIDPDRGIVYGNEAVDLASYLGYQRGVNLANMMIGMSYKYKTEYKKAIQFLLVSKAKFEEENDDADLARCLNYLGIVYSDQGQNETAMDYYQKAISINERLNNKYQIAKNEGNMCNLFETMQNYPMALQYGFKSLRIFEDLHNQEYIATALGNIGIVYNSMGNYDSALSYDTRALNMFQALGDKLGMAINYGNIGDVYVASVKDPSSTHALTGDTGSKAKDLVLAIDNYNRSISLSNEINQLESILNFTPNLAEAYSLNGDYKNAYATLQSYTSTKDSTQKSENKSQIDNVENIMKMAHKANQIEIDQLKKSNYITRLVASVIILLIIIAIAVSRLLAQMKSNKILAKEQKMHLEKIAEQATVLSDMAYTQSHDVRGEVATILGLAQVFNFDDPTDPGNKIILEGIAESTEKLDGIVKATIVRENEHSSEVKLNPNKNTLR